MKKILVVMIFACSFLMGNLFAAPKQIHPDAKRTRMIQTALVQTGYLKHASGHWDAATEAALRTLQQENGWQHKSVPDARALLVLNLGPNYKKLLNPETAMISQLIPSR